MGRRQEMGYRNLSHYMIGKTDRAGRLIDDSTKRALAEARKIEQLKAYPNHSGWTALINDLDHQLISLMGEDAFHSWADAIEYSQLTKMDEYYLSRDKLREIKSVIHTNIIANITVLVQK